MRVTYITVEYTRDILLHTIQLRTSDIVSHETLYYIQVVLYTSRIHEGYMHCSRILETFCYTQYRTSDSLSHTSRIHSVTHNTVGYIRDVVSHETLDCIQVEYMRVA